jgi:NAD(P)-dependent dehydrogenase (short-subunit alcohol dehydrogenase family)
MNRLETCKALALAGARVILCSRSVSAGETAVKDELAKAGHGGYTVDTSNVVVKALDLNSLASVKKFAQDFLATEDRLDFLVLNAGIMALPKLEYTDAGFEKQIGVNHFGHFYLVNLLKDKMLATPNTNGRIVVLSSVAHNMGSVVPADLHYKNGRTYSAWGGNGQSKMANLLFAKGLAERLKGTPLTAVSVHPGTIQTNLWKYVVLNFPSLLADFINLASLP